MKYTKFVTEPVENCGNELSGVEQLVGSETQHAGPQTSGKVSDSTSNLSARCSTSTKFIVTILLLKMSSPFGFSSAVQLYLEE